MYKKIYLCLLLVCVVPWSAWATELTVAYAANLQFAMPELDAAFTKETGIKVKTVIGSSGKLTAQIENGAPFDVFLSADEFYPDQLAKGGWVDGRPQVYAKGFLVLWTFRGVDVSKGLAALLAPSVHKVAIASPKSAPYGTQSVIAMQTAHLYPGIAAKLVYGENIAQTNAFIISGAVDIGLTAKSAVLAPALKDKGHWTDVDPKDYQPIAQAAVVLKQSREKADAQKYLEFLFSLQAKTIFKKYGYDA